MFMDISSEIIHSLLPLFLVSVLSASTTTVGLIEGIAEASTLFTKAFSGAFSDWLGKRKTLAIVGYALGAASKPFFAIASSTGFVFAARLLDRIGKGIRGAPRDALVADVTPQHLRGAAYGLRQSLDTIGAFLGPLLAMLLMLLTVNNFRAVFWIAAIPGAVAVVILVIAVREPADKKSSAARPQFRRRDLTKLGSTYWGIVLVGALFTMARFSEAFLLLRAESVGLAVSLVPLALVLMSAVYGLSAYPAGRLSDRLGRTDLLALGLGILIASHLSLALATNVYHLAIGLALWGLHMGLSQSLLAAIIADSAQPHLRGTAFGVFSLSSALSLLGASVLAGLLWDNYGPSTVFLTGAGFAAVALVGFLTLRWRRVIPS